MKWEQAMTTTERSTGASTAAKDLTEEYEVLDNGRPYMCKKVEYLGDVYEVCRRVREPGETVDALVPQPFIRRGKRGYDELVAYLDQFLTADDAPDAE
jgi:hypothetical protein